MPKKYSEYERETKPIEDLGAIEKPEGTELSPSPKSKPPKAESAKSEFEQVVESEEEPDIELETEPVKEPEVIFEMEEVPPKKSFDEEFSSSEGWLDVPMETVSNLNALEIRRVLDRYDIEIRMDPETKRAKVRDVSLGAPPVRKRIDVGEGVPEGPPEPAEAPVEALMGEPVEAPVGEEDLADLFSLEFTETLDDCKRGAIESYNEFTQEYQDAWKAMGPDERRRLAQTAGLPDRIVSLDRFASALSVLENEEAKKSLIAFVMLRYNYPDLFKTGTEISPKVPEPRKKVEAPSLYSDLPSVTAYKKVGQFVAKQSKEEKLRLESHVNMWRQAFENTYGEPAELSAREDKLLKYAYAKGIPTLKEDGSPYSTSEVLDAIMAEPGRRRVYTYGSNYVVVDPDGESWYLVDVSSLEPMPIERRITRLPGTPSQVVAIEESYVVRGASRKGRTRTPGLGRFWTGERHLKSMGRVDPSEYPEVVREAIGLIERIKPGSVEPSIFQSVNTPGVYLVEGTTTYSIDYRPVFASLTALPFPREELEIIESPSIEIVRAAKTAKLPPAAADNETDFYTNTKTGSPYYGNTYAVVRWRTPSGRKSQRIFQVVYPDDPQVTIDPDAVARLAEADVVVDKEIPTKTGRPRILKWHIGGYKHLREIPQAQVPEKIREIIEEQEWVKPLPFGDLWTGPTLLPEELAAREERTEVLARPPELVSYMEREPETRVLEEGVRVYGPVEVRGFSQGKIRSLGPAMVVKSPTEVGEDYVVLVGTNEVIRGSKLVGGVVPSVINVPQITPAGRELLEAIRDQERVYLREEETLRRLGLGLEELELREGETKTGYPRRCDACGKVVQNVQDFAPIAKIAGVSPQSIRMSGDFLCEECLAAIGKGKNAIVDIHLNAPVGKFMIRNAVTGEYVTQPGRALIEPRGVLTGEGRAGATGRARLFNSVASAMKFAEEANFVVKSVETGEGWRSVYKSPEAVERARHVTKIQEVRDTAMKLLYPKAETMRDLSKEQRRLVTMSVLKHAQSKGLIRKGPIPKEDRRIDVLSPEDLEKVIKSLKIQLKERQQGKQGDIGEFMTVAQMPSRTSKIRAGHRKGQPKIKPMSEIKLI